MARGRGHNVDDAVLRRMGGAMPKRPAPACPEARPLLAAFAVLSCVIVVLVISGCHSGPGSGQTRPDLSRLVVDPLACTSLSMKKEVEIRRQLIDEPSVMQGWIMMALRYREGGDERTGDPALPPGYTNITVVIEEKRSENSPLVLLRDYSVVEEWKLDPGSRTKLCYLWMIDRDHASLRVMAEDLDRALLAEREIPISDEQAAQLKLFHRKLLAMFLARLKNPSSTT